MIIIPAIDIRDGNCVMLTQGKIEQETIYSKDPVFIAKLFQAKGAKRLHIVDLDGAFLGFPKNIDIIQKIRAGVQIPIQVGGGVRNEKTVDKLVGMGVDYVIIGTIAIYNPDVLRKAFDKYRSKIMVAIDARENKVAIGGWKETTSIDPEELAKKIKEMGVEEVIYTDIAKDGTMEGPNIEGIRRFLKASKLKVIASGGISNMEDVKKLMELEKEGLSGIIIGKALYTEAIKLEEVLKLVPPAE
jgi:phosphoribosylformimino-5-aminoimidazole carboxamide ribotide isomerase